MNAFLPSSLAPAGSPFDLAETGAYQRWRAARLACAPRALPAQPVLVEDATALRSGECAALRTAIVRSGFAIYRTGLRADDPALPRLLAAQLGMWRLDANWLAGEDGVSRITVGGGSDGAGGFIPYTNHAIGWHTDGYYHPGRRRIRGMVLHCVRPAARGGENQLLDPDLAYIALRDRDPRLVHALMQPDAMTIPAREDDRGVARPEQPGPVFSVEADGTLHMRYTARTRSIAWRDDAATQDAAAALREILASSPFVARVRMQPGMGLVGRNVLHDRSAFADEPQRPRLVLRARFLDAPGEAPWPNG